MTPDLVAQLSAWLAATDLGFLELRGPGVDLRLVQRGGRVEPAPPGYEPRAAHPALNVTSPSVGRVRLLHPQQNEPLAAHGSTVAAGQPILLLEIGTLLLPVTAPQAGTVAAVHVADGDVVGFGSPLVGLIPASAVHDTRPIEASN